MSIGYQQMWEDMQLELTDPSFAYGEPFQTVIANVGDAIVDGMDVEISFLPADGWSLGLVTTYLFRAEIDKDIRVFDDRDPDDLALFIPGGTRLPLVADLNLSTYAEYAWDVDLMGGSNAYLRLQYAYTGSSFNRMVDNDGDPDGTGYGGRAEQPSYQLWDLRAGISNAEWEITAYVDNIADERVVFFNDTGADVFWGRQNFRIGMPRSYGINIRRYFN